jgi:two-component system, chemotaxis family, chemotaxis protein CheY
VDAIRQARPIAQQRTAGELMAKALVVDDSRAVRMILVKTLKEFGYEVQEAANGKEALEAIEAQGRALTLVLADWNMPEINGLDLLKRLRQNPALSSLVMVMVTSETDIEHIAQALEAGASEYVMKPFTRDVLVEKLRLAGVNL